MRFVWPAPLVLLALWSLAGANKTKPHVNIVMLVRNKAHSLPYSLSCLMRLSYPKSSLSLHFYTDYNEDDTEIILNHWAADNGALYKKLMVVNTEAVPDRGSTDTIHVPSDWKEEHMDHVIYIRELALNKTREENASYAFMLDADVFITYPSILEYLILKNHMVAAPMLLSEGLYSNFWAGMLNYYYQRTDKYKQILQREETGCFEVPMVHSAVLIDLRDPETVNVTYDSTKLTESYGGPRDDIITFADSVKRLGKQMAVCNDKIFGFVQMPLVGNRNWQEEDRLALSHVLLEALALNEVIPLDVSLERFRPPLPDYPPLQVQHVYLINLKRRQDRRFRMEASLKELGIQAEWFEATDGNELDLDAMLENGLTLMREYEDPYHKRPMKLGEIGCFFSHYYIWENMTKNNYSEALILEDDVRFEPHFRQRIYNVLEEVKDLEWDLLYIGRKVLTEDEKHFTKYTVKPSYTYWTLGYILRQSGAQKLIDAEPFRNLLPVDEFLPIMFDEHPNDTWKSHFKNRNLIALSAAPLLVTPTHYTGQPGYVSDTEDSSVVKQQHLRSLMDEHDEF